MSDIQTTFSVVTDKIPPRMKGNLLRDFTEEEKERIYVRIHMISAPPQTGSSRPAALWVFGPSAVGKSALTDSQASSLFGTPQNAVLVDGAEFREVHAGWQAVVVHGMINGCLHADAWPAFKAVGKSSSATGDGISGQLKSRIVSEAIRDRKHLVIPEVRRGVLLLGPLGPHARPALLSPGLPALTQRCTDREPLSAGVQLVEAGGDNARRADTRGVRAARRVPLGAALGDRGEGAPALGARGQGLVAEGLPVVDEGDAGERVPLARGDARAARELPIAHAVGQHGRAAT